MAIWNRNDNNYGNRGEGRGREGLGGSLRQGLDRVQEAFSGQSPHNVTGTNRYDNGYRGTQGGMGGGLRTNSWADGAYTADAADRLDRDTDLGGNRGRDTSPFHGGFGGTQGGGYSAGGMNRGMQGGMDRDGRGWNLGGGDEEWGHNWGAGGNRGMQGGMGMQGGGTGGHGGTGGGFMSRAQNAVRRGWDQMEDRFDGDDDDRTLAYGNRPTGRGGYDRDMGGRGMTGGYGGMGGGYGATGGGTRGRVSYDTDFDHRDGGHGYKTRQQTDAGDPFGDRQAHTPIRMVNGDYDDRYDNNRGMMGGGMRGGAMGGGMRGGMQHDYDHDGDVDMGDRMRGTADRMSTGARRGWNNVRDRFDRDEPNRMNRGGYDRDVRGFNNSGSRDWF